MELRSRQERLRDALNEVVTKSTWRPDNTLLIHDGTAWNTLVGRIVMATNGDEPDPLDIAIQERDAAVSARQEAERVLRAVLDANDAWQAVSEDDAPSRRAMVVAIRSARATLARTREPAGEGT